jgi:hypothetical protein
LLANEGKWKKVSKKRKFKEEFGREEEAFNDFFRVGIAFHIQKNNNKRIVKLYENFYKSDIIIGTHYFFNNIFYSISTRFKVTYRLRRR